MNDSTGGGPEHRGAAAGAQAARLAGALEATEHPLTAERLRKNIARHGVDRVHRTNGYVAVLYGNGGADRYPDAHGWQESVVIGARKARILQAEAVIGPGGDRMTSNGLPPGTCARVRAAMSSDGTWPGGHVTAALSGYAGVERGHTGLLGRAKELEAEDGTADLAVAVAVLAASGQVPPGRLQGTVFLGELAPDGSLRGTRNMVSAASWRAICTVPRAVIVPAGDANDMRVAAAVQGAGVSSAGSLAEVRAWLNDRASGSLLRPPRHARQARQTRRAPGRRH